MISVSQILKWVSGGLEAFWGIPFVGGAMILGMVWLPLPMMLALHIVTVVFSVKENKPITGNILGIITSCIAWIPVVGMIMHIISAIFILLEAGKDTNREIKE